VLSQWLLRRRRARAARKADQALLDGIDDISAPLLGPDELEQEGRLSPPPGVPRSSLPPELRDHEGA